VRPLQFLDVGRHVNRPYLSQVKQPAALAPVVKPAGRLVIGPPRVLVADVCCGEFPEPLGRLGIRITPRIQAALSPIYLALFAFTLFVLNVRSESLSDIVGRFAPVAALGIEFVSRTEGVDTSTPAGKMVFTVLGAVAELERSLVRERVKAGLRNAKARGKRVGRQLLVQHGSRTTVATFVGS
jgi:Resolvase, N terminal domain